MILKEFGGNVVYKLHEGDDPNGMMGLTIVDSGLSINRGRMSAKGIITRQDPDRIKDVMVAKGGLWDDHRKNPTVQIQHSRSIPCGRAQTPLGAYTVKMCSDGSGWEGETYFSQSTQIGEQAFRLVEEKVLCGMSIGFLKVQGQIDKAHGGGTIYKQWRAVEYSHVAIPEHPDCLVQVVYKGLGGKPLCDPLMDILKPLCPPQNESVVGGWEQVNKGEGDRKYGCVMVNLTGTAAQQVLRAGKSIPDDDLAEDGRETVPHVTVRYGFKALDPAEVERIASVYGPLSFSLGKPGVFAGDDHDVVYYSIQSSGGDSMSATASGPGGPPVAVYPNTGRSLWDLHEALGDLPHDDTHPEYVPHACIAYVKSGLGEKYRKALETSNGAGAGVFVQELIVSDARKNVTVVPLIGTKSLKPLPSRVAGWRQKMYDQDPNAAGGVDLADPNAGDPNNPNQPVEAPPDTEGAWLTIASDLLQQAMDGDDGALKRLKILVDTKRKLADAGVSGDMPDLGEDDESDDDEDGDSFADDTDDDGEKDGPPKKKKKEKSLMVFRRQDADILTKGYKLGTSILVTKNLDRNKLDAAVREWLDELETVSPVKTAIVQKSLKARVKTKAVDPSLDGIDWDAIANRVQGLGEQVKGITG